MNSKLEIYARAALLESLSTLPEPHHRIFKLMYGRLGGKRSIEDAKAMGIDEVVAEMEPDKLNWALDQVDASIRKIMTSGGSANEM